MPDNPDEIGRSRTPAYWDDKYRDNGRLWGMRVSLQAKRAMEVFSSHGTGLMLDVGCGYGRDLEFFESEGLLTVGLDMSSTGLRMASDLLLEKNNVANIVQGNSKRLPFPINIFDGIWCNGVLQWLAPGGAMAAAFEMKRVTAPGGVIAVSAFSTADPWFGKGRRIGKETFHNLDRTTHFFTEESMERLLKGYEKLVLEEINEKYLDGEGREHEHTCWFYAVKKPEKKK